MDSIATLSTSLAQAGLMQSVGVAMLSKSMDDMETMGNSMINMMKSSMELSVNPAVGGNIDVYI
ncbi:MAG: YjfB family protein [Lachnospiraceae bacterium]|nr:YjfB family protein [Lachnospiraceae bacterium]